MDPARKGHENIQSLYLTDEYIARNPRLHEQDSPWKITKITPLVDRFLGLVKRDTVSLLDVGGGAGIILQGVSAHIAANHRITINKLAVDLSPGMLELQKERIPDLKKALNEDIRKTSLDDKEIDLALMVDLLEHVENPSEALEEVKRISHYVILKVPLEDNVQFKIWNFVLRGKPRRYAVENYGHINIYNAGRLKRQIKKHTGRILHFSFTNVFDYHQKSLHYKNSRTLRSKLVDFFAAWLYKISPDLCSFMFSDFAIVLVECY